MGFSVGCLGGDTIRQRTESGVACPAGRTWMGDFAGESRGSHNEAFTALWASEVSKHMTVRFYSALSLCSLRLLHRKCSSLLPLSLGLPPRFFLSHTNDCS